MNTQYIEICKKTYDNIIKDGQITDEEWVFLMDLHRLIFNREETNRDVILSDIQKVSKYRIILRT